MPKLPGISQKDAVRVFRKIGYALRFQGKHLSMSKGKSVLVIPRHTEINAHTMGKIAEQAGLTPEEFRKLL